VLPIVEQDDGATTDASTEDVVDAQSDDALDAQNPDASPDGPINLLQNPGFEDGLWDDAGCGPSWTFPNSVTTRTMSTSSRTGARACYFCTAQNQAGVQQTLSNVPSSGAFRYGAWIEAASPTTEVQGRAFFTVKMTEPDAGNNNDFYYTTQPTGTTWTQMVANSNGYDGGITGLALSIQISGLAADAGTQCMLVDDAFVYAE